MLECSNERSPALYQDELKYFEDLCKVKLCSYPELNKCLESYLNQVYYFYEEITDEVNENIDIVYQTIYQRANPTFFANQIENILHPLSLNPILSKLINPKRKDSLSDDVQPYFKLQPDKWMYVENTIKTISHHNSLLFSIDLKGSEINENLITEIGISIYDPHENRPEDGNITPLVHNYDIVVEELFTLRNKNYFNGVKDCYLLGELLILPYAECCDLIQPLMNYFLCPKTANETMMGRCLVGHGITNDLNHLKIMGIMSPTHLESISSKYTHDCLDKAVHIIDTYKLHLIL